jgi:hypothetical protein
MRFFFTLGSTAILPWSQIFLWSPAAVAAGLADCNAQASGGNELNSKNLW